MPAPKIALSAKERRGKVMITGEIIVQDENGAQIRDADVFVTWTLPDGTTQAQTAATNRKGVAKYTVPTVLGSIR